MSRLLIAIMLAACTHATAPVAETPVGTYELVTVGGQPLPTPVGGFIATGGSIHLHDDHTFLDAIRYRYDAKSAVVADSLMGTWHQSGDSLIEMRADYYRYRLSWRRPSELEATWMGKAFTYRKP